jgi:hypothetical protein
MASIIRIKRSSTSGNPSTLGAGELAYSALADNGSNGGDRLYIGMGTETAGNAVNHVIIGGKYYTGLVDAAGSGGTLNTSAKSIPVLSATGTIDKWLVGNLQLTSNTLSSTNANGDVNITPNGTGKVVLTNPYVGDTSTTLLEYIYDAVGGTVTAGTGITSTVNDAANTTTLSITNTGVTSGSYGSTTAIPVITINAQGQITSASTASITTSLGISGDTGTDTIALATDTLNFVGGTGITSTVNSAANSVTFDIDSTVATLSGTQTLTNKTINLGNNTLIATSAQIAAAVTDETGSGSLVFSTSPTLTTPTIGAATATSITGSSGNLSISAAAGNNSVNIVPTGTGTVDVANARITSVGTPTQTTDAATKGYVDSVKQALDIKDSVKVATTANLTVTASGTGAGKTLTNAGTQAAITIDSIVLIVGDRILVKDQSTASNNGIYTVTNIGSASTNWVLTRAIDADGAVAGEVTPGMFTFVEQGTVNADSGWVLTTDGTVTVDTTALTFVQFSGAGQVIAGNGLTKTGNQIDVVGTANRITANADSIDIASTYVGQTSITTLGTVTTGTWNGSVIADAYINDALTISGGTVNNTPIGATTASTGAFTTLSASGAVNYTGTTDMTALGAANVVNAGGLSVAKKVVIGTGLYIGSAATSVTLTTPAIIAKNAGSTYAQIAMINSSTSGSADFAAYADNGSDTAGWADMGMTGSVFSDAAYTITGKNDGYFFVQSVSGTGLTGNMVLATGGNGTTNDIIFGTGGFLAANEKMRFIHATGQLDIETTTASSSTSTGALRVRGGVGIAGNIYMGGNLTGAGAATSALDGFAIDGGTY